MTAQPNDRVPSISDAQKEFFRTNGYLILSDVLDDHEKEDLVAWTKEVKEWPDVPNRHMPYEEIGANGKRFLTRTENYANFHPGFGKLLRGTRLTGLLAQLSGEPMVLFKEKINYKLPGGGGFDAHSDAPGYQHIAAVHHLTILIAVDPATMENGCLEVVPGSQLMTMPLKPDNAIQDEWCEKHTWVPAELNTGDFLIFGSYLAHRSAPNRSQIGRAAIYATYNAVSDGGDQHDVYYAHRLTLWPPTFQREPGKRYTEGRARYGWGTPQVTIEDAEVALDRAGVATDAVTV